MDSVARGNTLLIAILHSAAMFGVAVVGMEAGEIHGRLTMPHQHDLHVYSLLLGVPTRFVEVKKPHLL